MIRDPEDALLAELTAAIDDAELLSEAEYEDPDQFGDALLNNLPAIAYALGAGLPVTAWKSAAKNPGEEERVLRAVRTWGDQARLLLNELVTGNMTLEEFRDAMVEGYRRQARNSYIAGRRAMGDLEPLSPNEEAKLAAELDDDEEELGNVLTTPETGGGLAGLLLAMIFDPTNYLGSGLPGDPFAGLPPPLGAGKGRQPVARAMGQLGQRLDSFTFTLKTDAECGRRSGPRRSAGSGSASPRLAIRALRQPAVAASAPTSRWLREAKRGEIRNVDLTLAEYLDEWLAARRKLRASTLALYRSHVETHILPALGRIPVGELQPRHIEAFVDDLQRKVSRTGRPLKASTVRGVLTTLKAALAYGVKRRELPDNPAQGVEPPEYRPELVTPMYEDEAANLVDAVRGHWLEHLVRLVIGSGIRIGEALALDQRDVHQGYITLRRPKTQPRTCWISEDAQAALAEAIRLAPRRGPKEPIFYGRQSGDRLTREVVTHALPKLLEEAGLPRRSPHALRHGVATLMLSKGVPLSVIGDQLGHRSLRTTTRYAHVVPELQQRAVGVMDEAIRKRK